MNDRKNIIIVVIMLMFVFFLFPATLRADANQNTADKAIKNGRAIFIKSGCLRCHSLIKDKNIRGIDSLYDFGNRHLTIKETMKAIRSCKMDTVCSEILTNAQVKDVAYYLNSLVEGK